MQDFTLWAKMKERGALLSFDLEITARCNNACRHCYINLPAADREARSKELTLQEISSIADQAVALGALWVLISGGEPLLREDFEEIYMLLKRKGLLVSVFTNATLIRDEHIVLFKKYPPPRYRNNCLRRYRGDLRESYRMPRIIHCLYKRSQPPP